MTFNGQSVAQSGEIKTEILMSDDVDVNKPPLRSLLKRWAPLLIIATLLTAGYLAGLNEYFSFDFITENRNRLMQQVNNNFIVSLVAYFAIYTIAVAVSFPGASLITIVSGFLFGWLVGGLTTIFAATLGATIIFLAARTSFGDLLQKKPASGWPKCQKDFRRILSIIC